MPKLASAYIKQDEYALIPLWQMHIRHDLLPDSFRLPSETYFEKSLMKHYAANTEVEWKWGNGSASGKVRKKYTEPITKTLQGSEVKRDASDDDPAYLIEQDDGSEVLKSHSEIRKAS